MTAPTNHTPTEESTELNGLDRFLIVLGILLGVLTASSGVLFSDLDWVDMLKAIALGLIGVGLVAFVVLVPLFALTGKRPGLLGSLAPAICLGSIAWVITVSIYAWAAGGRDWYAAPWETLVSQLPEAWQPVLAEWSNANYLAPRRGRAPIEASGAKPVAIPSTEPMPTRPAPKPAWIPKNPALMAALESLERALPCGPRPSDSHTPLSISARDARAIERARTVNADIRRWVDCQRQESARQRTEFRAAAELMAAKQPAPPGAAERLTMVRERLRRQAEEANHAVAIYNANIASINAVSAAQRETRRERQTSAPVRNGHTRSPNDGCTCDSAMRGLCGSVASHCETAEQAAARNLRFEESQRRRSREAWAQRIEFGVDSNGNVRNAGSGAVLTSEDVGNPKPELVRVSLNTRYLPFQYININWNSSMAQGCDTHRLAAKRFTGTSDVELGHCECTPESKKLRADETTVGYRCGLSFSFRTDPSRAEDLRRSQETEMRRQIDNARQGRLPLSDTGSAER